MKVTFSKIRSFIFILLFFTGISVIVPLHNRLLTEAHSFILKFSQNLEESTGLHFTYESLSPSILSNFYVKNIIFYDENDEIVLSAAKTRLNYRLSKILKKDFQNGFSSIVVDGITVQIDKIPALKNSVQKKKKNGKALDINEITKLIPNNVKLKNISFNLDRDSLKAALSVRQFEISSDEASKAVNFSLNTSVSVKLKKMNQTIKGSALLSGSIFPDLEGSTVLVKLSDLTNGSITLNKLNFLAAYSDKTIDCHIIQTSNPVSLGADFHIDTKDLNVQLKTEDIKPANLIHSNTNRKLLKKIQDFAFTTDTIFKCNLNQKTLNFISDSSFYIPDSLFEGGLQIKASLFGDEKQLELTDFSVDGPDCSSSANLKLVYKDLQLSGFAELPYLVLKNKNVISTELYIDSLEKGFMIFSPQFFAGNRSLTALQFSLIPEDDELNYTFEASDYSHEEAGEPGTVKIDGTVFKKGKYAEANFAFQSLYADSAALLGLQFIPAYSAEKEASIKKKLSSYMFTGDAYISTDLKSISYNIPYIVLADTKKENKFLMLSFGGNEQSLQVNNFSYVSSDFAFQATGSLEKNMNEDDMFFVLDMVSSSIPYHFTGNIMKNVISVSGDYDSELTLNYKSDSFSGSLNFDNLPLVVKNSSFILSNQTNFSCNKTEGFQAAINKMEIEKAGASYSVSPKLLLSGSVTRYGLSFDSLTYSDFYSSLTGNSDFSFDYSDGSLNFAAANLNLKNEKDNESIKLELSVTNPEQQPLSAASIMNSFYLNGQLQVVNFNLNRFVPVKNENNILTSNVSVTGTLSHPYVAASLENLSLYTAGSMLHAKGTSILEDKNFSIQNMEFSLNNKNFSDIKADFNISDMTGSLTGLLSMYVRGKSMEVPVKLEVSNSIIPEGSRFPDSFMVNISSSGVKGEFVKKPFSFSVSALYNQKNIAIFSSDNIGLSGTITEKGDFNLNLDNKSFARFDIEGTVVNRKINLLVHDINADLKKLLAYFDMDRMFIAYNGNLQGQFYIGGTTSQPEFAGELTVAEPELSLNIVSPQKLNAPSARLTVTTSEIHLEPAVYSAKNTEKLTIETSIFLNRWSVERVEAKFKALGNQMIPGRFVTKRYEVKSDICLDIVIIYEKGVLEVNGTISGDNTQFNTDLQKVTRQYPESKMNYRTDLTIILGTHAIFNLDPLIRAIFIPDTKIVIKTDTQDDTLIVDGDMHLRSGDISYLNRNFYIKSGVIKFVTGELSNPLVTLSAETRERDTKGQTVKIVMSVENQYLQSLNPRFSAIPAKSENEIRTLLGQIAVGDSSSASNFLFAAGDYAIQSSIGRKIENSLRDLLNFDIFSVRTNVLQNTLNYSVSRNSSRELFTIGNFLDNSTVYIGKYLNSSLYVDAMLHVSINELAQSYDDLTGTGNLIFQPEFGMELEAPFANIRWNVAPDINAIILNGQYLPSSSVTLSWKFAF